MVLKKGEKMNLENVNLQTLKDKFCENFKVTPLCLDLMDEITDAKLKNFIISQFEHEFSEKEIEEIFDGVEEDGEEVYDYINYEAWILSDEPNAENVIDEYKASFVDEQSALDFLDYFPGDKIPEGTSLIIEKVGHRPDESTCIDRIAERPAE